MAVSFPGLAQLPNPLMNQISGRKGRSLPMALSPQSRLAVRTNEGLAQGNEAADQAGKLQARPLRPVFFCFCSFVGAAPPLFGEPFSAFMTRDLASYVSCLIWFHTRHETNVRECNLSHIYCIKIQ